MKPPIRQRKPNRMPRYDYSARGCYFVTICIKNKEENSFGKIVDKKIEFSLKGNIANKCWLEIPNHFPHVRLDEFVIMPNHIHGILTILSEVGNANLRSLHATNPTDQNKSPYFKITTTDRTKMLLSKIIQNFKAAVTREINKPTMDDFFIWQKSFYDHIISSYKELVQIRQYIKENPTTWSKDDKEFDYLFRY